MERAWKVLVDGILKLFGERLKGWFGLVMEGKELNLNKEGEAGSSGGGGGGGGSGSGDGFIDRSKVRILLCDNDSESSKEVFTLLLRCSYQGI